MRIIKKAGGLIVLNVLLWVYSEMMLGLKNDFTELIYSWAIDFESFNAACIHWIAMRISIWLYVLWKMHNKCVHIFWDTDINFCSFVLPKGREF